MEFKKAKSQKGSCSVDNFGIQNSTLEQLITHQKKSSSLDLLYFYLQL